MVPRQWIERAQQIELPEQTAPIFAIDVARHGGDETVIVRIAGGRARVVWAARGLQSIMPIAAHVEALSEAEPGSPPFWIDADGTGWGVFDRASELGLSVAAFQGGSAPADRDRHLNLRAEAWWTTREALRGEEMDLDPADRQLAAQLGAVTYSLTAAGQVQVQPKARMRRSPDRADALCMAVWAAAQQYRGALFAGLMKRSMERTPPDPLLADAPSVEEMLTADTLDERRRPWRESLDCDLPTWPTI